jgi:hypothetical protein
MLGLAVPGRVHASPPGWTPVDGALLDTLRGGFIGASGLQVSLGIERLVTVNGEVVSRTSLQLADVGRMDPEQARQAGAALSAVKLIQNGSGNMVTAGFSSDTLGGTVIQNSLDGQRIESSTIINSTVNSIGLLKTMNFSGNVSDAIARAAGP